MHGNDEGITTRLRKESLQYVSPAVFLEGRLMRAFLINAHPNWDVRTVEKPGMCLNAHPVVPDRSGEVSIVRTEFERAGWLPRLALIDSGQRTRVK